MTNSCGQHRDFTKAPRRSRLEARILQAGAKEDARLVGGFKRRWIGAMRGTVVELGPGPGVNMQYYAPGVHVIAVEPNPAMHEPLTAAAREHGVDLELRTGFGEELDVADDSVDGVVGTLLLCGVDDPRAVVVQVRRVLKPGGVYVFHEHVAAAPGSFERLVQRVVKVPHRWFANGCEVDRDTAAVLRAGGFSELHIEPLDAGLAAGWTRTRLIGHAIK